MTEDQWIGSDRQRAANALMGALENWAHSLGDAGVTNKSGARYFPGRQMERTMRTAHREGKLFERLTEWLPRYSYRGGTPYAQRMREIVEHGAPLWESVVAETDRPWSRYISDDDRRTLHKVVADVHAEIARGSRLREKMLADARNGARRPAPLYHGSPGDPSGQ